MSLPPYISDILSQPAALRQALAGYRPENLDEVTRRLSRGEYRRIVMTGMGASFTACYPAWLRLTALGVPVSLVETSELLHYAPGMVDGQTLLWMVSQSGRSAEIRQLIARLQAAPPAATMGTTNDPSSPLGQYAAPTLALHAGTEATVSTRTYVNSLAVLMLAAVRLSGGNVDQVYRQMEAAGDAMQAYLEEWQERVSEIKEKIAWPGGLMVIGRGPSLAAVRTASFTLREASKVACEGTEAAQFRHGPLEAAGPGLALLVYEGLPQTANLNRDIALEAVRYGANVLWISPHPDADLLTLPIPPVPELALPLVEILPLQMLTIALAEQQGFEPGKFRYIGKVTERE